MNHLVWLPLTATDCHWPQEGWGASLSHVLFARQSQSEHLIELSSLQNAPLLLAYSELCCKTFSHLKTLKLNLQFDRVRLTGGKREREREQFVENIHRHLGLNILGPLSQREGKMSVSVFKISVDTQTLTIFSGANGRRGRDIIDRRYLANITLTNTDTHNIQARHYRSQIKADTT